MRAKPFEISYVLCDRERLTSDADNQLRAEELTRRMRQERNINTRAEISRLSKGRQEKSTWFREQERSARSFVRRLGLTATKGVQISIIDTSKVTRAALTSGESRPLVDLSMASYMPGIGIIVKKSTVDVAVERQKPDAIGTILVHELAHASEPASGVCYLQNTPDSSEARMYYREGFMANRQDGTDTGIFFSEAMANFTEGLYNGRCEQTSNTGYHANEPEVDVPPQYVVPWVLVDDSGKPANGPNGHVIELLAWGVENYGIGTSNEFIATAYDTYSEDAEVRLAGHRKFATMIDAIAPGLYPYLRDTEYTKESFTQAHQTVYDIVTAQ